MGVFDQDDQALVMRYTIQVFVSDRPISARHPSLLLTFESLLLDDEWRIVDFYLLLFLGLGLLNFLIDQPLNGLFDSAILVKFVCNHFLFP